MSRKAFSTRIWLSKTAAEHRIERLEAMVRYVEDSLHPESNSATWERMDALRHMLRGEIARQTENNNEL